LTVSGVFRAAETVRHTGNVIADDAVTTLVGNPECEPRRKAVRVRQKHVEQILNDSAGVRIRGDDEWTLINSVSQELLDLHDDRLGGRRKRDNLAVGMSHGNDIVDRRSGQSLKRLVDDIGDEPIDEVGEDGASNGGRDEGWMLVTDGRGSLCPRCDPG